MKRLIVFALFCCVTFTAVGQAFAQDADATAPNPVKHVLILGWDGYGTRGDSPREYETQHADHAAEYPGRYSDGKISYPL